MGRIATLMAWVLMLPMVQVLSPADTPEVASPSAEVAHGHPGGYARIVTMNGIPTLEADGRPFLIVGAQCDIWRSTRQDEKTVAFFDGYRQMHATTVSIGVPWSKLETAEGRYDFAFLDWFIAQAVERELKLVVNLFNSNVCGKVREAAGSPFDPGYVPAYILAAPDHYQRMVLPGPWTYDSGGPPMCPNDARTRERERRLCVEVAEHLRRSDIRRTVIMLQIDNEFSYQQWVGGRPADERAMRCHCMFCEEKWASRAWMDGEQFMFDSFADYVRVLSDAITAIHPVPLVINSPWWPPRVIPMFLDRCLHLALVGIDGVCAPNEPNMLSRSQLGRNIPFAAENPSENPATRFNLDVLPYYTLIGQQGIGNLLWECGPPSTVVEDVQACRRYAAALYPIRYAQLPIATARGTKDLIGWFAIRDRATEVTGNIFGQAVAAEKDTVLIGTHRLFVREGSQARVVEGDRFAATLGDLRFQVSDSAAGFIVRSAPREVVLAIPQGRVAVAGAGRVQAMEGRFDHGQWTPVRDRASRREGEMEVVEIREPAVMVLTY